MEADMVDDFRNEDFFADEDFEYDEEELEDGDGERRLGAGTEERAEEEIGEPRSEFSFFEDIREEASESPYFADIEAETRDSLDYADLEGAAPARSSDRMFGMTPAQRLVIAAMLLGTVCILSAFCLLVTERIAPPF
jgi:hypothetical protein